VLEQSFDANGPQQPLIPSEGFAYSYDLSKPVGNRIVGLSLNGAVIDPAATYRVTTNSFLAQGGDSFTLLAGQREAVIGMTDLDALQFWLEAVPLRAVPDALRVSELRR
jgi:5'-nucleotidase